MSVTSSTAKELLRFGCNLIVEEGNYVPSTLKELASLAKAHNANLTIKAKGKTPSILKDIALIGGNNITIIV